MTDILDLIEILNDLDIEIEAMDAITATAKDIADYNTDQLMTGHRSDGTKLPDYRPSSVKDFGKEDGPIKLYDTGDFHKSFRLDFNEDGYTIKADDLYDLEKRYGENIYGLDDLSQETYNEEEFFPVFANNIEQKTGLKFAQ